MRRYRKTIRLKDYDYSEAGGYFITICTSSRKDLFGEISNQEIVLDDMREVVEKWWLKLENKFTNVQLDYHVVMPNDIHGIIVISEGKNDVGAIHELPFVADGGMTGYHPVGFIDLIAEMMKKKGS